LINKIAILISWPRELDIFSTIISIDDSRIEIIVDDYDYSDIERVNNYNKIIDILYEKNINYIQLSNVLGKSYYKILFSTELSYREEISIKKLCQIYLCS